MPSVARIRLRLVFPSRMREMENRKKKVRRWFELQIRYFPLFTLKNIKIIVKRCRLINVWICRLKERKRQIPSSFISRSGTTIFDNSSK